MADEVKADEGLEPEQEEIEAAEAALEEPVPEPEVPEEPRNVVVMHGREFELEEPTTDIVIRLLNVLGRLAVRSETYVSRAIKAPGSRAALFGLLAVISEDDLVKMGSAVLQFESDREGRKWLKEHGVKVAPLIEALMINFALSEDLMEALRGFFGNIDLVAGALERIGTMVEIDEDQEGSGDDS